MNASKAAAQKPRFRRRPRLTPARQMEAVVTRPVSPRLYLYVMLRGKRRSVLSPAHLDEMGRYLLVRGQLDPDSFGSATIGIPFVGRKCLPPAAAHNYGRGARQCSGLELIKCLRERITTDDHMALHPRFESAAARHRQREMAAGKYAAWRPPPQSAALRAPAPAKP